jgi:Glucose-6-phosphate isomerase
MESILKVDISGTYNFAELDIRNEYLSRALSAFDTLIAKDGLGGELLEWVDLPSKVLVENVNSYMEVANSWREDGVETVVVIGIGGSYVGTKSIYNALSPYFRHKDTDRKYPELLFAGLNLSGEYLAELKTELITKKFAIIYVSKSGTTIETSIAFRVLKNLTEEIYGKEGSKDKIVVITGGAGSTFGDYAVSQGYKTFPIPDNIGGRFSVLTAVGMLPIAVSGFDILSLLRGAASMERTCKRRENNNPAITYASMRNLLHDKGYNLEILATYNPRLKSFTEWWAQLFGESEGKNGLGIFLVPLSYTEDMHGLGQYIQEGRRFIFETILSVESTVGDLEVISDPCNPDGFEFLAGRSINECCSIAEIGIKEAHVDGGVPNIRIVVPSMDEYNLGALLYFFEFSCGISGYMLGVNPFNQPGVEYYKRNIFSLLGKPGFDR